MNEQSPRNIYGIHNFIRFRIISGLYVFYGSITILALYFQFI